jgi:polyhydroxyalkanoate synthesis regulator phasin
MAKQQKKRSDQVRTAVDEAFQAAAGQVGGRAQLTRDRAQDLVDELSGAAGRLREVLDDLRPPTTDDLRGLHAEVKALRGEVKALGERVAALESKPKRAAPARKPAAKPRTSRSK